MSEFKELYAEECAERLLGINDPLILVHIRPDGDCIGTAAALSEVFRQLGRDAYIASHDPIPERLGFILEHTGARLADKYSGRTPVSVDVASRRQLGSLGELSPVLMIDHHAVGERYADRYLVSDISSAAEALMDITDVLIRTGKIKMTEALAYSLFCAISSDTGCFCFSNTSKSTYLRAAELSEAGIDTADINHRLFHSKSKEQIKAEGMIGSSLKTALGGRVAYTELRMSDITEAGLREEHFETAIDIVRALRGAEVAFFVRETANGSFKVSLRSTGIDVASIAERHNGGGHIRAAGCTPNVRSAEEASKILIAELDAALSSQNN